MTDTTTPARVTPKLPPYAGSRRRYAIAFNALTAALRATDRFVSLSEREYVTTAILNALDADNDDGRMLPAGTETVEQFGTRVYRDGQLIDESDPPVSRERAQQRVDWHAQRRQQDPGWTGHAELVHRHQHTTPWTPVEETP
ncbi:hypothetical protein [Micromonospora wenchangensis]|uniref:hypothetical protein n=1 Tax=Micromonospora wenchangensis TaxID=1185415 RepID=UPI003820B037